MGKMDKITNKLLQLHDARWDLFQVIDYILLFCNLKPVLNCFKDINSISQSLLTRAINK